MKKHVADLSDDELRAELARLKDILCDAEDMHAYATGKTTVHIGGGKVRAMQEEFEEECRELNARIGAIEAEMKSRGIA